MTKIHKFKITGYFNFIMILLIFALNVSTAANTNPPETNRMKPGFLPTPFTADQIRIFNQNRYIKFIVETPGKPNTFNILKFSQGDIKESDYTMKIQGHNGKLLGPERKMQTLWTDLQAHGSYPEANTKLINEKITTSLGTFNCWLYITSSTKNGDKVDNRVWFAKAMPGPPVLVIHKTNDKTIFKMTMIETEKKPNSKK